MGRSREHNASLYRYVVTMNTIGNCMVLDTATKSAFIAPKGGFGGIGCARAVCDACAYSVCTASGRRAASLMFAIT